MTRQMRSKAGGERGSAMVETALTIPLLEFDEEAAREQATALAKLRGTRDEATCQANLARLRDAAASTENVVPAMLDCARSYCTLYEIRAALESVFGAYREPVFF